MPQLFPTSRPPHSPAAPSELATCSRLRTTTPAAWHATRYTESGIPGQTQSGSQRPSHIGMRIRWPQNILRPQLRVLGEVVVLQRRFVLPMTARRYCASAFHPSRPDHAAQPASHASDNLRRGVCHRRRPGVAQLADWRYNSFPCPLLSTFPRIALVGKVSPVGGSIDFFRG
jgi:hypothetical protein